MEMLILLTFILKLTGSVCMSSMEEESLSVSKK